MFLVSHLVAGLLTHEGVKGIKDRKKRAAVGLVACSASHAVMDLMPFYHDAGPPMNGVKQSIKMVNMAALILFLLATADREKDWRPTEQMAWGLAAFLLWDAFWAVDDRGGPHRMFEPFGEVRKWEDPKSVMLEAAFVAAGLLLTSSTVRDKLRKWLWA